MTASLEELVKEINNLNPAINKILSLYDYGSDDLSGVEYDENDPEQLFMLDQMHTILEKLGSISHALQYLNRPIKGMGRLQKNSRNRYELPDGYEFTSGYGIEYLATDDRHSVYVEELEDYVNKPYWCASSVEHNGTDYYIVGTDEELEGLTVRYR